MTEGPGCPADWELVRGRLLGKLLAERGQLQAEVTKLEDELSSGSDPRSPIDPGVLQRLHAALEEYERVVSTIDYPHRHDPKVLTVPAVMPALQAAGVAEAEASPPSDVLRNTLSQIQEVEGQAARLWAEVPNLPPRWTPAAKLAETLR